MTVRKFDDFIGHVASLGFHPKTVIDAGVAWGTPSLYSNFPDAYFILVEALRVFEENCNSILKMVSGEYHIKAVSDYTGRKSFHLNADINSRAGFSINSTRQSGELIQDIEIVRLDDLLAGRKLERDLLLKLDVQGHDLRAAKGGARLLQVCDMVILEADFFNEQNQVKDIIAYMDSQGFQLYEVFGMLFRPHDNAAGQCDMAFVPRSSKLVSHKGWI